MRLSPVLLLLSILLTLTTAVGAQERVALVIGNAEYAHAPRLANPLNDAADVSAALIRLGFAVTKLENASNPALRQALRAFSRAVSAADIAVVFYAGHGLEVDRRNYLVPVDARLASDQDVEFETVSLELVIRSLRRAAGLRLVILDACRENPFVVSMQRAGATRSLGRGLARVETGGKTLVAYAAKEGTVASDGEGRNSPYSEALLRHLEEPGLGVELLFHKVRDAVLASTGGRQEPFVYGSWPIREAYLTVRVEHPDPKPSRTDTPTERESVSERLTAEQLAAQRLATERELLFWQSVKDSTDPADFQAYLDRYPGGAYEVLARNRLRRPVNSQTTAAGAQKRVALVVGNAAYEQNVAALRNPVNDATAVAAALQRLGFAVIEGTDLDEDAFYDQIAAFDDAARDADVALFFYAGHGLQVDGRNYLAPVDLKLETRQDLRRHAIELAAVLEVMRSETNLVILDACRNNPLAADLARSLGMNRALAASRGLARVESTGEMLIAYATAPDDVAADGTGEHSPYTAALLEHLETPGLSVGDLFTQVTQSVLASTGGKQRPWTHASLSKVVRLAAGEMVPVRR